MEDFLSQIEKALNYNLYYLALQAVLTLPDICSSLLSSNPEKRSVGKEYIDWCNNNFSSNENISSEDCYYFRCSMLHEGQTQHSKSNFKRIMFIEPGHPYSNMLNNISFIMNPNDKPTIDINLNTFCTDMITSVKNWWLNYQNDPVVQNNYKNMVKRYPNGLPPYIVGVPIIS